MLIKLLRAISAITRAWRGFTASGGDIDYFSDLECQPRTVLHNVMKTFDTLAELEPKSHLLVARCERRAKNVSMLFISSAYWAFV